MCTDTLIVIQCRFNSRRLPGKALMPMAGTSMLGFLIRRLQWGLKETGWNIMLATTLRQDDDAVAEAGSELGLQVFRGEEDDVLARFGRCMEGSGPSCPLPFFCIRFPLPASPLPTSFNNSGLKFAIPVEKPPRRQAMPRDNQAYTPVSIAAQGCQNVVPYWCGVVE